MDKSVNMCCKNMLQKYLVKILRNKVKIAKNQKCDLCHSQTHKHTMHHQIVIKSKNNHTMLNSIEKDTSWYS
jgi:hypothetical protein